eukprot:6894295-Prymnesium_polylepis.2
MRCVALAVQAQSMASSGAGMAAQSSRWGGYSRVPPQAGPRLLACRPARAAPPAAAERLR